MESRKGIGGAVWGMAVIMAAFGVFKRQLEKLIEGSLRYETVFGVDEGCIGEWVL